MPERMIVGQSRWSGRTVLRGVMKRGMDREGEDGEKGWMWEGGRVRTWEEGVIGYWRQVLLQFK